MIADHFRLDVIKDGQQKGIDFALTPAERALPLAELRTRIFDPCRAVFERAWPEAMDDYDIEEAKLIERLGLTDG